MQRSRVLGLAAVAALALTGQAAFAQSATINDSRFGIYQSFTDIPSFDHSPDTGGLPRYDVGESTPTTLIRNYFTFNLSGVNFTVTSATLRIFSFSNAQADPSPQTNTLNIFSLELPLNSITDTTPSEGTSTTFGPQFNDLGDGTLYGSTSLLSTAVTNGSVIDIDLTNAIADINTAGTGSFGVGGALVLPAGINEALYFSGGGVSANTTVAQLLLTGTLGTVAPEPGTVGLALVALPGLGLLLRRRR